MYDLRRLEISIIHEEMRHPCPISSSFKEYHHMKRSDLEQYLNQYITVTLFNDTTYSGYLHKTREEAFRNDPNLYWKPNYYFFTETPDSLICTSPLFRCSHVKRLRKE